MNVSPISFGYGQPMNGVHTFIMQSAENRDRVMDDFQKNLAAGIAPDILFRQIMDYYGYTAADFTDNDMEKITRKVESVMESSADNYF